jgi:hypothetical protein
MNTQLSNAKEIRIPGPDHPITISPAEGKVRVTVARRIVAESVGDCLIRFFVGPNRIFRAHSADKNAVVRAVALVRTITGMLSPDEQRHNDTVAWEVVNRGMALLLQPECSRRS